MLLSEMLKSVIFSSRTGMLMLNLSASGLTRMAAAVLPFHNFNHIVPEDKV
jgi:hypothetical protein